MARLGAFRVAAGEDVPVLVTWRPPAEAPPGRAGPAAELALAARFWRDWACRCTYVGPHREAVIRSLITLKSLTYAPPGGFPERANTPPAADNSGGTHFWATVQSCPQAPLSPSSPAVPASSATGALSVSPPDT